MGNLYVMNFMKSYKSKGYVKETFTWQHSHYILKDEGIAHLRDFLHLPAEIVPFTLKRPATRMNKPRGNVGAPRKARAHHTVVQSPPNQMRRALVAEKPVWNSREVTDVAATPVEPNNGFISSAPK